VRFREADLEDFPLLVELTEREGWNYTEADFVNLKNTGCAHTLVAEDVGGILGMITVIDYDNMGWISNVLVKRSKRGSGIGKRLLAEGIGILGRKETVSLFAYERSKKFYQSEGFRLDRTLHFVRYKGYMSGAATRRGSYDFLRFQKECFGYNCPKILNMLASIGTVLSPVEGEGFAIVRADPKEPCVGPVVADDPVAGKSLLYAAFNQIGAGCRAVLPRMVEGTDEVERVSRLYLGERPILDEGRVFAFSGLELG